jgi:hypothetical protein
MRKIVLAVFIVVALCCGVFGYSHAAQNEMLAESCPAGPIDGLPFYKGFDHTNSGTSADRLKCSYRSDREADGYGDIEYRYFESAQEAQEKFKAVGGDGAPAGGDPKYAHLYGRRRQRCVTTLSGGSSYSGTTLVKGHYLAFISAVAPTCDACMARVEKLKQKAQEFEPKVKQRRLQIVYTQKPLPFIVVEVDGQTYRPDQEGRFGIPEQDTFAMKIFFRYDDGTERFRMQAPDNNDMILEMQVNKNRADTVIFHAKESVTLNSGQTVQQVIELADFLNEKNSLEIIPENYLHLEEAYRFYTEGVHVTLQKPVIFIAESGIKDSFYIDHKIVMNPKLMKSDHPWQPYVLFHEFSHYAMHEMYGNVWDQIIKGANHAGFASPTTGDSYAEGFAAFMANMMAFYLDYTDVPSKYPPAGSLETNYAPWECEGKAEEFAIASMLYDLVDDEEDAEKESKAYVEKHRATVIEFFNKYDIDKNGFLSIGEIQMIVVLPLFDVNDNEKLDSIELTDEMKPFDKDHDNALEGTEIVEFVENAEEYITARCKEKNIKIAPLFDIELIKGYEQGLSLETILEELQKKEDDTISVDFKELWPVLAKPRSDFSAFYQDLLEAFPGQAAAITQVYINHGLWADTAQGNGTYDNGEAFIDTDKDDFRGDTEPFIDYPAEWIYDDTETVGTPTNYQRLARKSTQPFAGHYLKSKDPIPVTVIVADRKEFGLKWPSHIYTFTAAAEDGLVYVPVPEDSIVEAGDKVRFTSKEFYAELSQSKKRGYFKGVGSSTGSPLLLIIVVVLVLVAAAIWFVKRGKRT